MKAEHKPNVSHAEMLELKREAKEVKKRLRCSHIDALNIKAESLGYENWDELSRTNNVSRSSKKET